MENLGFYDLDELVLRCRYPQSRHHLEEAVKCYRAGAYRSCVVATWLAVVYDFIYKVNVLHLEGDGLVADLVEKIEKAQEPNGVEISQRFEKELVDKAQALELISPTEALFLQRLHTDRHLCAHPSMQALNEPFQATAELARLHLRNSVEHFLQNPPVQGKAALLRIQVDIDSEGFPRTIEGATEYFKTGRMPLARASLIRNLAITLTKSLLLDPESGDRKARQFAALGAILSLFTSQGIEGVRECITTSASKVQDENLAVVFAYVRFIPESWNLLEEWMRIKMRTFLETGEVKVVANSLLHASRIPSLKEIAMLRLEDVPSDVIIQFEELQNLPESIDKVVDRFLVSASFEAAKVNGRHLVKLKDYLSLEQRKKIVDSFALNSQVAGCFQTPAYLHSIVSSASDQMEALRPHCRVVYDAGWHQDELDAAILLLFPDFTATQKKNPYIAAFGDQEPDAIDPLSGL